MTAQVQFYQSLLCPHTEARLHAEHLQVFKGYIMLSTFNALTNTGAEAVCSIHITQQNQLLLLLGVPFETKVLPIPSLLRH